MPFKVISNVEKSPGRSLIESFTDLTIETFPGYKRFFSLAAGIFDVGRRPKPREKRFARITIKT